MPVLGNGQIFERYQITRWLGSGTAGESYEAEDRALLRKVTLKLIHPWAILPDSAQRQFFREMQGMSMLNHPFLATMLDYGEVNGRLYIARRYVSSGSLLGPNGRLWFHAPLPVDDAFKYTHQLAQALFYIHQHGYLHGSLSFSNVLVLRGPNPSLENEADYAPFLLADVGLASFVRRFGKPQIEALPVSTAPEQSRKQIVPASDQFALAVLLYFWLAGRPPYLGTPDEVEQLKQKETVTPVSRLNPGITAEQDTIILRALSASPKERHPSVLSFAESLLASLPSRPHARQSLPGTFMSQPETPRAILYPEPDKAPPVASEEAQLQQTPVLTPTASPGEELPAIPSTEPSDSTLEELLPVPEPAPLLSSSIPETPHLEETAVQAELAPLSSSEEPQPELTPLSSDEPLVAEEPATGSTVVEESVPVVPQIQAEPAPASEPEVQPVGELIEQPRSARPVVEETPAEAAIVGEATPEIPQVQAELAPADETAAQLTVDQQRELPVSDQQIEQPDYGQPSEDPAADVSHLPTSLLEEKRADEDSGTSSTSGEAPVVESGSAQPTDTASFPHLLISSPYTSDPYEFVLTGEETNIGRAGSSDLLLDQDDLTSRHHALIKRIGERVLIFDKRSHNGVFINGQKIEGERGYELADGDHISIGNYELIFRSALGKNVSRLT